MIRIVKGKRYDTERAELVARWNNIDSTSRVRSNEDFDYTEEALYVTPNGNWFLCGTGNYGSKYGSQNLIIPISAEAAMEWLEERQETGAIEEYFRETIVDA